MKVPRKGAGQSRKRLSRRQGGDLVHVLVVDDSAVVREIMTAILSPLPDLTVATASDPIIALEKMRRHPPQVIVLDLEMPRMDGLTFLRRLMATNPIPIVICSSLTGPRTEAAVSALEAGAVDIVVKPRLGVRGFLCEQSSALVETVRAAARARVWKRRKPRPDDPPVHGKCDRNPQRDNVTSAADALLVTTAKLIAIGASTGGTEAIRAVLTAMPPSAPGLVVVQHMPAGFTTAFAARLDSDCRIDVREAQDGDRVITGRALIAPGDRHLQVRRSGSQYIARLSNDVPVCRHKPSVDVLFRSVANAAGPNAVGVIMTGMGNDGAEGLQRMRQRGALTIAQDERTSVVFGMPKEAIAIGAVDLVLPIGQIPAAVLSRRCPAASR